MLHLMPTEKEREERAQVFSIISVIVDTDFYSCFIRKECLCLPLIVNSLSMSLWQLTSVVYPRERPSTRCPSTPMRPSCGMRTLSLLSTTLVRLALHFPSSTFNSLPSTTTFSVTSTCSNSSPLMRSETVSPKISLTHQFFVDTTLDIEDCVKRVNGRRDYDGNVHFQGWSRMALPIKSFTVANVAKPNIGENRPAQVIAEVPKQMGLG